MSPGAGSALRGVAIHDALDSATVALRAAGVDAPRLDAELLLAAALGIDRAALVLERERTVEASAARTFRELVRRRAVEREPVAYLLGTKGFRYLDLHVDHRVLIPRPESELLVEAALELAPGTTVVDVGTGSGAIALALAQERPDLHVLATDISADALAVARANAERLGIEVGFHHADLLAGLADVEAIVSNPPYVQDGAPLSPEIVRHEPATALYAGADGFTVIRRLVVEAAAHAARWVAIEVGAGQAGVVAELLHVAGFAASDVRRDLAGIERVVVGRR